MEELVIPIDQPKYKCPVHGIINSTVNSTIAGYDGDWCMVCFLENVVKPSCEKVEFIEE